MTNYINFAWIALVALIIGGFAGHGLFPREIVNEADKTTIKDLNAQNADLATKLANAQKPATPVNPTVVEVDNRQKLLDNAVKEYFAEVDDEDLLDCDHTEYSLSELSQKGVIKSYSITRDISRRDSTDTVNFEIEVKFDDSSDERPCYRTDDVEVTFHSKPSEDTEITINSQK